MLGNANRGFYISISSLSVGAATVRGEEEIRISPSGHCTVTELNSIDKSEDMMSDTELPRNTLSEDEETKLKEIDGKITVKMEEIAKKYEELAALHKERMKILRKISGKKRCDGDGCCDLII